MQLPNANEIPAHIVLNLSFSFDNEELALAQAMRRAGKSKKCRRIVVKDISTENQNYVAIFVPWAVLKEAFPQVTNFSAFFFDQISVIGVFAHLMTSEAPYWLRLRRAKRPLVIGIPRPGAPEYCTGVAVPLNKWDKFRNQKYDHKNTR